MEFVRKDLEEFGNAVKNEATSVVSTTGTVIEKTLRVRDKLFITRQSDCLDFDLDKLFCLIFTLYFYCPSKTINFLKRYPTSTSSYKKQFLYCHII